jgi:hypothetical protein
VRAVVVIAVCVAVTFAIDWLLVDVLGWTEHNSVLWQIGIAVGSLSLTGEKR